MMHKNLLQNHQLRIYLEKELERKEIVRKKIQKLIHNQGLDKYTLLHKRLWPTL